MSHEQKYTFGDSTLAAQRLGWLAEVFEPGSQQLLGELAAVSGGALDLGCGPGYTTELLQTRLSPAWTVGLDNSPRMLELARARASGAVRFIEHEVSVLPFPVSAAELVYARFLVTHLGEPAHVLRGWSSVLAPGGRLVLEETAFMRAEHPAFQQYYACVQSLQAHYGQNMYVGQKLAGLCEQAGYVLLQAGVLARAIPAAQMARLHAANLATWSQDPFARASFDPEMLRRLGEALAELTTGGEQAPPVTVGMGQVVAQRIA
ncbi:MAG TPA: class I SAM-dependent methyltransferase [Polyangiales bacterium]